MSVLLLSSAYSKRIDMKTEAAKPFETVIPVYQSIRHNALEEWNILQYRCEKARNFLFSTHFQTGFGAHPALCVTGSRPLSLN
jgi:hypothetical protein